MGKSITLGAGAKTNPVEFRAVDKHEPDWFYDLRKAGWEFYHDSPLPSRTVHLWRYTDPSMFVVERPEDSKHILPVIPDKSLTGKRKMSDRYSCFGYNQSDRQTVTQMDDKSRGGGVIFKDLYSGLRENPELVSGYLGGLAGYDFGKFEALNLALWNSGYLVYIPDNMILEKPIYLHRQPTGGLSLFRLLVIAGMNSEFTLVDDYSGQDDRGGGLINSVVEIFAGDVSKVRYVNFQRLGNADKISMTVRTKAGRDSEFKAVYAGFGGSSAKINAGTVLAGRGAASKMSGVIFADGKQRMDYHTGHHHVSGDTYSDLDFKVILKDKGKSAYTGLIRIEKEALNCNAYQENRNLMLNPGTKAESIPELEIMTDQVSCTHGATMGPIDQDMIFYLKSRGFTEAEAVMTIVEGFVETTLKNMPEDFSREIREKVAEKLES